MSKPQELISSTGMRLVKLLVGKPPQSIIDLIEQTGVTRTAVAEQIKELIALGFVEQVSKQVDGPGRPRYLYQASHAALVLLFASHQSIVVPALWQAIDSIGGESFTKKVVADASHSLANHFKKRIRTKTPATRLRRMAELLSEEGGLVDIFKSKEGRLCLRKRSCAFISMYDEKGIICGLDQEMISQVVGAPVRQLKSRHNGDPCCVFELVSNGSPSAASNPKRQARKTE